MREGTDRGFDRVVFFSDAVVAIAITLLILPMVDRIDHDGSLLDLLRSDRSQLLAFVVSFAVIANFWIAHHGLFELVDEYNSALLWVNMLWLASIVFLPFPSEVLGVKGSHEAGVRAFYMGSLLLSSVAIVLLRIVITRSPELRASAAAPPTALAAAFVAVGAIAIALVVGTAVPAIGLWSLVVLVPAEPIARRVSRRAGRER